MKKKEEEEEEKRKLERNLVVSRCCCLVQSPSNVKQKIKESFNYTRTTHKNEPTIVSATPKKRAPPRNLNDSLPVLIIVALSLLCLFLNGVKLCLRQAQISPFESI